MRTRQIFKEINKDHRRFFGEVASTLDLSESRRRSKGAACAAEEDGEDGLPVPSSDARAGAEGDREAIGRAAIRDLLPDLRVVTGFLAVPPLVGLVAALTTLPNLYAFWLLFCLATIVAGFATLLLGVPTFLVQEESGWTEWRIYLRNGALLGCIVSSAVEVPLFGQLLAHVLAGGAIDEIAERAIAISSVAAYCAFLGIVGAATFWLIARPDHARWRGRSGESISRGRGAERALNHPPFLRARGSLLAPRLRSMRSLLVTAVSLLVMTGTSSAADPDIAVDMHNGDLASIIHELPADHPIGTKATVTLVSLKRALHLDEPILSTFIVNYLPGGSAVLHRSPIAGYILVHVLSGAIRARAWEAGVGTYRSGQTWVEPAFANNITSENASMVEPARALVVLITNDTGSPERAPETEEFGNVPALSAAGPS